MPPIALNTFCLPVPTRTGPGGGGRGGGGDLQRFGVAMTTVASAGAKQTVIAWPWLSKYW